ncbi:MAG: sugar ABC transporter substrate-binding protein [Egibacteraceae bacterium]
MRAGRRAGTGRRRREALGVLLAALTAACVGAPATTEARSLTVVMADDWATTEPVTDAVRDFEANHPGVTVQVQGLPFNQIMDAVAAGVAAGDPPDVVQQHAFAAAAVELAEPVDDLWQRWLDPAEYLPGAVKDVSWAGRRYGVPLDTNAMVLFANTDALRATAAQLPAGPTTFAEVARVAEAVSTRDGSRRGIALASSSWTTYGWIRANGGEIVHVADDGAVRFSFTDPAVVAAVDFLGKMVRDMDAFPPETRDVSADAFTLFRTERAALHVSGTWEVAALDELGLDWSYDIRPLPRGVDGTTQGSALGGSSLFIPRGSGERALAFEFMIHLTGDDYALRLAKEEGRLPARPRVFDDPFFHTPVYRTVLKQLETAHPLLIPAFPEAAEAFKQAYEDVLTGRAGAQDALRHAQAVAVRSLDG